MNETSLFDVAANFVIQITTANVCVIR